jgi:hypothetical protein
MSERLYVSHHKGSRFRGRTVRVLVRPRNPRLLAGAPNNVLCQDVETGERFVCPWRGLRRR